MAFFATVPSVLIALHVIVTLWSGNFNDLIKISLPDTSTFILACKPLFSNSNPFTYKTILGVGCPLALHLIFTESDSFPIIADGNVRITGGFGSEKKEKQYLQITG